MGGTCSTHGGCEMHAEFGLENMKETNLLENQA